MIVAKGAVFLSTGVTYSKVSETGMTSTINTSTGAISVSAISATFASATYRVSIDNASPAVTIDRVLTINKSLNGATGAAGVTPVKGVDYTDGLRGIANLTRLSTTDLSSQKASYYATNGGSGTVGYECQLAFNDAYTGTIDRTPRAGDRVTLYQTAWSNTYLYAVGGYWAYVALKVDGSLIVDGSVLATSLTIASSTNADGIGRIQLSSDKLEVYSGNNRRVVIGKF
jgi:hypothetical protein